MTNLKERMQQGGMVAGWSAVPSPFLAETMACSGFDAITIDLQHGVQDYGHAVSSLQAMDGRGVPILCRVHWNEPGILMKVLDAGFNGVICPLVNTREQAQALATACHYPPLGGRSFGPYRATATLGADYFTHANDWIVVLPMIETAEAVRNLDEILAVNGISGIYIGPNDLALSMGLPPQLVAPNLVPAEPVLEQILHILSRVKAAGKLAGIACGSPTMVSQMLQAGFHLATLCSDVHFFRTGMLSLLTETRAALRRE
jgi:4-hydroxy-2-oxoheptanedioate aldolase